MFTRGGSTTFCGIRLGRIRHQDTKTPLAYPVAGGGKEFAEFLSQWIMLKKNGLEYHSLYDHWILGRNAVPKQPRWSIIRDVLKWVK